MSLAVAAKRTARAAIVPAVFLSLTAYFLWQAQQGNRGLNTWEQRKGDLLAAQSELQRAQTDLAGWERRVQAMQRSPIDRDTLDERARAMLNLSDPSDVILPYPQGQRLF